MKRLVEDFYDNIDNVETVADDIQVNDGPEYTHLMDITIGNVNDMTDLNSTVRNIHRWMKYLFGNSNVISKFSETWCRKQVSDEVIDEDTTLTPKTLGDYYLTYSTYLSFNEKAKIKDILELYKILLMKKVFPKQKNTSISLYSYKEGYMLSDYIKKSRSIATISDLKQIDLKYIGDLSKVTASSSPANAFFLSVQNLIRGIIGLGHYIELIDMTGISPDFGNLTDVCEFVKLDGEYKIDRQVKLRNTVNVNLKMLSDSYIDNICTFYPVSGEYKKNSFHKDNVLPRTPEMRDEIMKFIYKVNSFYVYKRVVDSGRVSVDLYGLLRETFLYEGREYMVYLKSSCNDIKNANEKGRLDNFKELLNVGDVLFAVD